MTKHLHRLAQSIQRQLLTIAEAHPGPEWVRHAPRVSLDIWASLWAWHRAGEPITRITLEAEEAILTRSLPNDIPLAAAPLRRAALACQMPEPALWCVIARIPARELIQVHGDICWAEVSTMLVYCANNEDRSISSGYYNLRDQPTYGALNLIAGTRLTREGHVPVTDDAVMADDYRVTLAIHALYQS